MRITNKIMRNNSLYNINQNKIAEDHLSNQMTNQSKIVRPSDDPVVAIRALRLRSNVTNISQYYDKNAPDADQWLSLTADALVTVDEILTDLYNQAETASNKYLGSEDLKIIIEQMKSLSDEFYASGNVDYAGRYVFSGYRTDTPVTFTAENVAEMEKHPVTYTINEEKGYADIDTISYTDYSCLGDLTVASEEQDITNQTLYRLRLSYNALDELPDSDGDGTADDFTFTAGGTTYSAVQYTDAETAYQAVAADPAAIAYIPSTGEVVFGADVYSQFKETDTFALTYDKSDWVEGDINPVHYFKCTETTDPGTDNEKVVTYNAQLEDQDIYYDVGYNQKIQVNTLTDEVFTHDVGRDMDDFQHYLIQLEEVEDKIAEIEDKMELVEEGSAEYEKLEKQLEAANKAYTYVRDNVQTKFENQITKYQKYMDDANVAITNNATRSSRLDLISTRLMNQKTTFKELQTNNEDIDVTEIAVELTSADLTYQAALMATSKIMQTNLMNYI